MFDLFNEDEQFNLPQVEFPEFDLLRRTYRREIANVVDYYHNRVYAVKSNHFLVSLLSHLSVPFQYAADRYVETALARAPYVAASAKMTSEIRIGDVFDGVFFGEGSKEIIIYEEDYFNPFYAEREWERISAVRVLVHPKSDLGLLLPNGKHSATGEGLAVISINLALLSLQYRCFMQLQQTKFKDKQGLLSQSHFIHMYVLPNMLYSQMDMTIMNRIMNLYYGRPMGEPILRHPFMVPQYGTRVDNVLNKVLRLLKTKPLRFDAMIAMVPTIVEDGMRDALRLPDFAPTRQILWAVILSRLEMIKFFLDLSKESGGIAANRMELNHLKRLLSVMRRQQAFATAVPFDMSYDIENTIDEILAL